MCIEIIRIFIGSVDITHTHTHTLRKAMHQNVQSGATNIQQANLTINLIDVNQRSL